MPASENHKLLDIGSAIVRKRALEDVIKTEDAKLENKWSDKISKLKSCQLFEKYAHLNGMPKREFLKKLISIHATFGVKRPAVHTAMENLLNLLHLQNNRLKLIDNMHNLRELMVSKESRSDVLKWFDECSDNSRIQFIRGIENCVNSSSITLVEESCVLVAHLAYELEDVFSLFSDELSVVLLNSVASRVLPMNEYLRNYRSAYDQHLNKKMLSKFSKFTFPRFEQPARGIDHISISCAIYALTFVLQFTMNPDLVIFLSKHILTMNELTRFYALKVIYLVIQQVLKLLKENNIMWEDVPRTIFFEFVRIYNEKNPEIKRLLKKILDYLRSISKTKLPNYEELALRHQEEQEKLKVVGLFMTDDAQKHTIKESSCLRKWQSVSRSVGIASIITKELNKMVINHPRASSVLPPINASMQLDLSVSASVSKSIKKSMHSLAFKL